MIDNKFKMINDALIINWAENALNDFYNNTSSISPVMVDRYNAIKENVYLPMLNYYNSYLEIVSNKPLGAIINDEANNKYEQFLEFASNLEKYLGSEYSYEKYYIYTNALVLDEDIKKNKNGKRRNFYMLFSDVNSFYFDNKYDMNNLPDGVEIISGKLYISKNNLRGLIEN